MVYDLNSRDALIGVAVPVLGCLIGFMVWIAGGSIYIGLGVTAFSWLASLTVLIVLVYRRLVAQISKHNRELKLSVTREVENLYRQMEALTNVRAELGVRGALPAMRGWAISPDFAALLVEQINQRSAKSILECGSGVSTLIAGMVLKQRESGHLLSLEHDADYAQRSRGRILDYGLNDYVTVLHAPLVKYELDGQQWEWYDISAIENDRVFDFLIVDGPPDVHAQLTRYPVLHVLKERVQEGAVMLLDDANRPAERKCLALWSERMPGLKYELFPAEKGAAVVSI